MIHVIGLDGLEPRDLWAIRTRLTKPGSEWQAEVAAVLDGEASSCTPVAVYHADGVLVGWACSHIWRDQQTLEMFVDERYRRRGIATALAAKLVADRVVDKTKPVAVFSLPTAEIAQQLWRADVVRYERRGTEWVPV